MRNLATQYKELEVERERTENRLAQLQKSMCEVEEGELPPLFILVYKLFYNLLLFFEGKLL